MSEENNNSDIKVGTLPYKFSIKLEPLTTGYKIIPHVYGDHIEEMVLDLARLYSETQDMCKKMDIPLHDFKPTLAEKEKTKK